MLNKKLEELYKLKGQIEDLIDEFEVDFRNTQDSLDEVITDIEHKIYMEKGWKICDECFGYFPQEEWSTKVFVDEDDDEACICVNCEQKFIIGMEIKE